MDTIPATSLGRRRPKGRLTPAEPGAAPRGVGVIHSARHHRKMGVGRWSSVAMLMVLVAGCGSAQEDPALRSADAFYSAVAAQDGAAMCELLTRVTRSELEQSAGKPCDQAVLEEKIPSVREHGNIQVFGTMAQAMYDGDTMFLTRFGDRWLVTAVGCSLGESGIYDCQVKGS